MPRRQCQSGQQSVSPNVPYDFSLVPNCVVTQDGLQGSVLEEVVNRVEWVSAAAELVGLSHEAADRRARKTGSFHGIHHDHAEAERLSFSFISERAQTDDPIEGYMIRTKDRTRRLQGFLWFTNFTTWTHFFRWDSLASKAELHGRAQRDGISWDSDGSLSSELELQYRDGDPNDQGVIWPRVAEIALVGALECGGFLVQLALEALEESTVYDFVVVQATESSAGFYDRMGFKRVGALAKYITSDVAPHQARTVAYRHWAYPDEDVSKMDSSIMMAIKLRSGQVVQRIMPELGGIYPNRFRFVQKPSPRGVLCDSVIKGKPNFTPAKAISIVDISGLQQESRLFADLSPAGENREPARRNQACKPWVCYGNPSATCLSPKRNREASSNQLHRSSASLLLQNNPSSNDGETAVQQPLRVIKGPATCSSKKKGGAQEYNGQEPAGTAPELDQCDSSPVSEESSSRQKRQRRETTWPTDFVVTNLVRRYQREAVQNNTILFRKSQLAARRFISPKERLVRTMSAREIRYKNSSKRVINARTTAPRRSEKQSTLCSTDERVESVISDAATPKLAVDSTQETSSITDEGVEQIAFDDESTVRLKLKTQVCHAQETVSVSNQDSCTSDVKGAEDGSKLSDCCNRQNGNEITSKRSSVSRKMSEKMRSEVSLSEGRLQRHRMPVTVFRFHRFNIQSTNNKQKEPVALSKLKLRARCKANVKSWRQRNPDSDLLNVRAVRNPASVGNAPSTVEKSDVPPVRSLAAFPEFPFVTPDDGRIADLVYRPFRSPFTSVDGVIYATYGYSAVAPSQGNKLLLQSSDVPQKESMAKGDEAGAGSEPVGQDNHEFLWDKLSCEQCGCTDREDEMILCDSCDSGWHLNCLNPPLQSIPEGEWFCRCCVSKKCKTSPSETTKSPIDSKTCAEHPEKTCGIRLGPRRQRQPVARFKFHRGGESSGRLNSPAATAVQRRDSVSSDGETCKSQPFNGICDIQPNVELSKEQQTQQCLGNNIDNDDKRTDQECFWRDLKAETLRCICQDLALRLDGSQTVLVEKITSKLGKTVPDGDDLKLLRMFTLRSICSDTALTVRGSKDEISSRLVRFLSSTGNSSVTSSDSSDEFVDANTEPIQNSDIVESTDHLWRQWPCDGCGRSDREEEMILCDSCDAGWHLDCLSPVLTAIPDGEWFCPECAVRQCGPPRAGNRKRAVNGMRSNGKGDAEKLSNSPSSEDPFEFEVVSHSVKRHRVPVSRFKFSCVSLKV